MSPTLLVLLIIIFCLELCTGGNVLGQLLNTESTGGGIPVISRELDDKSKQAPSSERFGAQLKFAESIRQSPNGITLGNSIFIRTYRPIDNGTFGFVVEGQAIQHQYELVAVKFQLTRVVVIDMYRKEMAVLKQLECYGSPAVIQWGVPYLYYEGQHINGPDIFDVYAMTYLPHCLDKVEFKRPREMICMVSMAVLRSLKYIHSKLILHRDVKPKNIMFIGPFAVFIDYGFACHRDKCDNFRLGSRPFQSYRSHYHQTQSEADDVLGYLFTIVYKIASIVPKLKLDWVGLKDHDTIASTKWNSIGRVLANIPFKLNDTFTAFGSHVHYCAENGIRPDYDYLYKLFHYALHGDYNIDVERDIYFDWLSPAEIEKLKSLKVPLMREIIMPDVSAIPQNSLPLPIPNQPSQKPPRRKKHLLCGSC